MKNGEKFRDEIVNAMRYGHTCDFTKDRVFRCYLDKQPAENNSDMCSMKRCEYCTKMFAFWLDEEYVEPPKPEVDWSKVPVDTLVRVRDDENDKWALRYFKWFVRGHRTPFVVWADGATSKTAEACTEYWKYCELVEEEE